MRIIVDITLGHDARPTGTVRAADGSGGGAFSGNMEFLALIERLCLDDPQTPPTTVVEEDS